MVWDKDFEIKFNDGVFTSYGTLTSKTLANKVFKAGPLNINRKMCEPTTMTVIIELNEMTSQIELGDYCHMYISNSNIASGLVIRVEYCSSDHIMTIQVKDGIVLQENIRPHDDIYIDPNLADEEAGSIESNGTYTTTLAPTGSICEPLIMVEVLKTTEKELGTFVQAGAVQYMSIFDDEVYNQWAKLRFIGKNSVLNYVSVLLERDGTDTVNHIIEIQDNIGGVVWASAIGDGDLPNPGAGGVWLTKVVDTLLEGGKEYFLLIYPDGADPAGNSLLWYNTTNPQRHYGQVTDDEGTTWNEYFVEVDTMWRSCFNFELEYKCDWYRKYEGKDFTVDYSTATITWGGTSGFIPGFDNRTREVVSGAEYEIVRTWYSETALTTSDLVEEIANDYLRDIFQEIFLEESIEHHYWETAILDGLTKELDDENYKVESITDNPTTEEDYLRLGNIRGSNFNIPSADANNWHGDVGFLRGMNNDAGSFADIDTTETDELYIETIADPGGECNYGHYLRVPLTGDFDIEAVIDYAIFNNPFQHILFGVIKDPGVDDDYAFTGFYTDGGSVECVEGLQKWNGGGTVTPISSESPPGFVRVTRVGTTVKNWWRALETDDWTEVHSATNADTDDVYPVFLGMCQASETVLGAFSTWKVNEGSFTGNSHRTTGYVQSEDITNESSISQLFIRYGEVDVNNFLNVRVRQVSNDAILWTSDNIIAGTTQTYTAAQFGTIEVDYYIQILFTGDGDESPFVEDFSRKHTYPYGMNWSSYILAQTGIKTIMQDLHSMGQIEFFATASNPDEFYFHSQYMVEPDEWPFIYSGGERTMRTFDLTHQHGAAPSGSDAHKVIDHIYVKDYKGYIHSAQVTNPGDEPHHDIPGDVANEVPGEGGGILNVFGKGMDLRMDHPYFTNDEWGEYYTAFWLTRADFQNIDRIQVVDVPLLYVHPTMGTLTLFFTTNELYRVIDPEVPDCATGKTFKILEINYDFDIVWTLSIRGTDSIKLLSGIGTPDDDIIYDSIREPHGIHSGNQSFQVMGAANKGRILTTTDHSQPVGLMANLSRVISGHDPWEESIADEGQYLTTIRPTDMDYTWDLGDGDVYMAIGKSNANPAVKAIQSQAGARKLCTYRDMQDKNGVAYKQIIARFTKTEIGTETFPFLVKEAALYTLAAGGVCKSRKAFWQPASDETITNDKPAGALYHPWKWYFQNGELIGTYIVAL